MVFGEMVTSLLEAQVAFHLESWDGEERPQLNRLEWVTGARIGD